MTTSTTVSASPPSQGLRRQVFISYATSDRLEALKVCEAIERRGTLCWIACRDVQPGENYQEAIVGAIRCSRALVLVFSEAANNSDEIKKELSLVSRFNVPLMALRLEDVEPSDAFAYELSTRQWIDLFEGWDRSIDQLVGRIDLVSPIDAAPATTVVAPGPGPTRRAIVPNPSPTEVQSRGPRRRLLAAVAGTVLVALAGAGWFFVGPAAHAYHPLEVRLGDFQRLSGDLPAGLPQAMRDEISAAFADDGVIGVSTATAAPAGNVPAYVLSATARREADKVRVVARLANDRSGSMLWSNSFDYPAAQANAIPRKLAVDTGNLMRCALFGASTYPRAIPDAVLKDYLAYCHNSGIVQFQPTKALDFARKVVAALPDFSWGWSAVETAATASSFAGTPDQRDALRKMGLEAADRAIKLDPSNSEAFATKSALIDPNDLPGRESLLKQAIAARSLPCGCEHHDYGSFLFGVGRLDAAVAELRRAVDVLPLNGGSQGTLGLLLLQTGHPEDAKSHIDAAVDLSGDLQARGGMNALSAPMTGNWGPALAAARDPAQPFPQNFRDALIATYQALIARNPAAKAAAAVQLATLPPKMGGQFKIDLLAALGAYSAALQSVEAQSHDSPGIRAALYSPMMAPARADPAFPVLVQRLHLVDYWRKSRTRPDFCTVKEAPAFCKSI